MRVALADQGLPSHASSSAPLPASAACLSLRPGRQGAHAQQHAQRPPLRSWLSAHGRHRNLPLRAVLHVPHCRHDPAPVSAWPPCLPAWLAAGPAAAPSSRTDMLPAPSGQLSRHVHAVDTCKLPELPLQVLRPRLHRGRLQPYDTLGGGAQARCLGRQNWKGRCLASSPAVLGCDGWSSRLGGCTDCRQVALARRIDDGEELVRALRRQISMTIGIGIALLSHLIIPVFARHQV